MKLRLHSIFFLLGVSFLNVFAQPGVRDKEVLDKIFQRAKQTHSNSVLVIKDGKTVGEYYAGKKALVTIKHLLNHTSGMQDVAKAGIEVESSKDVVKLALAAELSDEPGTHFYYNNKGVNLLVGIVERASGKWIARRNKAKIMTLKPTVLMSSYRW